MSQYILQIRFRLVNETREKLRDTKWIMHFVSLLFFFSFFFFVYLVKRESYNFYF